MTYGLRRTDLPGPDGKKLFHASGYGWMLIYQCKFCNLFRHLKYRELPMEQIEAELKRVRELHGKPKEDLSGGW